LGVEFKDLNMYRDRYPNQPLHSYIFHAIQEIESLKVFNMRTQKSRHELIKEDGDRTASRGIEQIRVYKNEASNKSSIAKSVEFINIICTLTSLFNVSGLAT